jgi:hypothetical protein
MSLFCHARPYGALLTFTQVVVPDKMPCFLAGIASSD